VPPPGQGGTAGPHDVWGPGTRIPALTIAPNLPGKFVVDTTEHDTTSVLSTIEHRFHVDALTKPRQDRSGPLERLEGEGRREEVIPSWGTRCGGRGDGPRTVLPPETRVELWTS
jgi:Phosphoesterase family.